MKAIVLGKEINGNYLDDDLNIGEIISVKFEYLIDNGPDAEEVEIVMTKEEAAKYKLGAEVNLLPN